MYPKPIEKLIKIFSKLPTVGPRTAARFVFYLIKMPNEEFKEFIESVSKIKKDINICLLCFNPFDPLTDPNQNNLCPICSNNSRDKSTICIVEKETDLITIEKTKKYKGLYFILGGTINIKKNNHKNIRIKELKQRIEDNGFKEIIIATNATTEGEATRLMLERELTSHNFPEKPGFRITHLGRGIPVGGELEYTDNETLESAFESRK